MEISLLRVLQIALCVLGAIPALMALYDILLGENHSTSGSNKKLIGGLIFSAVAGITMQWVITEVEKAQSITGQLDDNNISIVQIYDAEEKSLDDEITVA